MGKIDAFSSASDGELVRRHGGLLSHAVLDSSTAIFHAPGIDGLIGFRVVRRCAVALGDPVCAPEHLAPLVNAFAAYCADQGWSILYAAASDTLRVYGRERGYGAIEFADLPLADPRHDPEHGPKSRHLRQHLNHTRRQGITVREYPGATTSDARLEAEVEAACEAWRRARHGAQIYLGRPRVFGDRSARRWFIAECAGRVVGVLTLLREHCFDARHRINLVFATPTAPPHTSELLVVMALGALREEGAHSVCLGISPQAELGRIEGLGGLSSVLARHGYRLIARSLHLQGKGVFWGKFGIAHRESLYLLFWPARVGLREIHALLRAFNLSLT